MGSSMMTRATIPTRCRTTTIWITRLSIRTMISEIMGAFTRIICQEGHLIVKYLLFHKHFMVQQQIHSTWIWWEQEVYHLTEETQWTIFKEQVVTQCNLRGHHLSQTTSTRWKQWTHTMEINISRDQVLHQHHSIRSHPQDNNLQTSDPLTSNLSSLTRKLWTCLTSSKWTLHQRTCSTRKSFWTMEQKQTTSSAPSRSSASSVASLTMKMSTHITSTRISTFQKLQSRDLRIRTQKSLCMMMNLIFTYLMKRLRKIVSPKTFTRSLWISSERICLIRGHCLRRGEIHIEKTPMVLT